MDHTMGDSLLLMPLLVAETIPLAVRIPIPHHAIETEQ